MSVTGSALFHVMAEDVRRNATAKPTQALISDLVGLRNIAVVRFAGLIF